MILGVCAVPEQSSIFADAGFDFIELHVQRDLKTMEGDSVFTRALETIKSSYLPCQVANCFIPGNLKITGRNVDFVALKQYVDRALTRAHKAGIDTIVFGSGGARRIPEGFSREKSWQQLVAFGKMVGPIAEKNGITIVVEPLNLHECNVLNTVGESGRYVEEVSHPSVKLLVDGYHWGLDNDSYDDIVKYGHLIKHVHIATFKSRRPPGLELHDLSSFFSALQEAKYKGRVSVEAIWENIELEAKFVYTALNTLTTA